MLRAITARVALLLLALTAPAQAQQRLKVFISVDMEGIAGVVTGDQLSPTGFEYQRFREFMTAEALAAIEGAKAAGATDIMVADSHGNMQNLLIEKLPSDVILVRGPVRPLGMMQGIDSTFHAAVFIGYHSATTNLNGVRAHTFSSARYTSVELNGAPMAESSFNAALAGYYGVPVVAISGDEAAVAELVALSPRAATAVVKQSIGFHAAATRTPAAAQAMIREAVRAGVARRAEMTPHRVQAPVRLDLGFKSYRAPELLAYLPMVQRTTAHSIRYSAGSILDIARFLSFIGAYAPEVEP
ncbi:MAG TPA: M55 family metallopeptidase [Gemmatimonas sp.]|uniref:M55 family metallopeptidase n=1 Tax=Gemmatimonas sp. TaxID=1962908 RepID=UPI002ED90564